MVPLRLHIVIDFAFAAVLFALGVNFGGGTDLLSGSLLGLGAFVVAYSMFTNYPAGVVRAIPLRAHLALDVLTGAALIGLALWLPQPRLDNLLLFLGAFSVAVPLLTETSGYNVPEQPRKLRNPMDAWDERHEVPPADAGGHDGVYTVPEDVATPGMQDDAARR